MHSACVQYARVSDFVDTRACGTHRAQRILPKASVVCGLGFTTSPLHPTELGARGTVSTVTPPKSPKSPKRESHDGRLTSRKYIETQKHGALQPDAEGVGCSVSLIPFFPHTLQPPTALSPASTPRSPPHYAAHSVVCLSRRLLVFLIIGSLLLPAASSNEPALSSTRRAQHHHHHHHRHPRP